MTLAELSHLTQINRSTAHRLPAQLHAVGILERIGRGRYRIGQALFHLGLLCLPTFRVADGFRPCHVQTGIRDR
jgi:DNA-binding IclR family transcriptional regulator